jgi:hypothetical protein
MAPILRDPAKPLPLEKLPFPIPPACPVREVVCHEEPTRGKGSPGGRLMMFARARGRDGQAWKLRSRSLNIAVVGYGSPGVAGRASRVETQLPLQSRSAHFRGCWRPRRTEGFLDSAGCGLFSAEGRFLVAIRRTVRCPWSEAR